MAVIGVEPIVGTEARRASWRIEDSIALVYAFGREGDCKSNCGVFRMIDNADQCLSKRRKWIRLGSMSWSRRMRICRRFLTSQLMTSGRAGADTP
jgi:hypothetical protein